MHCLQRIFAVTLFVSSSMLPVAAHFPWLATDDRGHAVLWFGESTADRTYHMPEKIAAMTLNGENTKKPITTEPVNSDDLVGIRSRLPINPTGEIYGVATYGLYHGTKLTYHVEHLPQPNPQKWLTEPRSDAPLQTILTAVDQGVAVTVLRNGNPLINTDVKLFDSQGAESASRETDDRGMVQFKASEIQPGMNALVVGVIDKQANGTLEGEDFDSTTDYLTATFRMGTERSSESLPSSSKPRVADDSQAVIEPSGLPDLPEELTSFGAAIAGNQLYVYGGHTGDAHSYSTAEQSNRLWSLELNGNSDNRWQKLAEGPSLQGLALVAYEDRIVRIGGFTAQNALGDDHDLQSQASVASFAPGSQAWVDLPSLPEPRSSHDAAVLGDHVYVIGGWQLSGSSDDNHWHETAWKLNLRNPSSGWQPIATPPLIRRAASVAAHDGKIYVIGGMQAQGGPTTRVNIYDPQADRWIAGPTIPGSGMSGFGSSSFAAGGRLVVTTMDGFVHELMPEDEGWRTVAQSRPARFFHRMLPISDQELLMIGGANMEIGKFTNVDLIRLAGTK